MKRTIQTEKTPRKRFMMVWPMALMLAWAAMCVGRPTVFAATSADELYREGKFDEAEKLYAEGDMDHPKDTRYRYNRGCAAYQKGDFQSATAAFASVMRRTEEEETRFKAAYNLGNVAFKQKDFASAAAYYKQALLIRPEAEDARYNLELALREMDKLEKQKKEQEQQQPPKKEGQKGDGSKEDQKDEQQDKPGEQGEKSETEKKEPSQDQQKQGQPKGQKEAKNDRTEPSDARQPQHEETPKDLSGKLAPMQQLDKGSGQDEKAEPEASEALIDRKKAEALLDNVQEDRSRFLQYQLSKERRRGPRSGKEW
jgi:Ca-activated chloride channel family protein